ncbi:mammalian cell entry protein [Mycobacterium paraffinicum]|uniref:Mammalian cell entry protein n=2 Tax=Mycobacterium paraffinicum TaxID=53378 RepID=A0A1Q4I2B8_9MYCO|nr:MlaD family protein [Mycobacterium paraffinicum]OJZ76083.1 mammalian cell entry protein [Mycobacterium paraffinicum]
MPDAVGLYAGNPVTQMGYPIGTVKSVSPGNSGIRVEFTVTQPRQFPADVKAVIRSTSLLTDRTLELVGTPGSAPKLAAGTCIPLNRSFTPKSLSQVVASTTKLINSISPDGSTNVADTVRGLDQALHATGPRFNQLMTNMAAVLDSPDQAISSIASVIANLAQLTTFVRELSGPIKEILLDLQRTLPNIIRVVKPVGQQLFGTLYLFKMASDIEVTLGEPMQSTFDATSVALRKLSAHAPRLANLLNPVPWWINTAANYLNAHAARHVIRYRPPMYRIRTPDGVGMCNIMNARMPGSCANVQGTPYAVDVALLQYVLTQAANR